MAYDFKKEFRELYRPSGKPGVVTVPPMSYVAVRGKGNPNAEGDEYQNALPLLYGVAYTIKMSKWIGYIFLDDFGRTKPAFLNSTGVMYPSVECILKLLYQCT